jgi:hypothetical protein
MARLFRPRWINRVGSAMSTHSLFCPSNCSDVAVPRTAKKRHEQTISSAVNKKLPLLWKTYIDDPL